MPENPINKEGNNKEEEKGSPTHHPKKNLIQTYKENTQ
jgi:hypothetical protein